MPITVRQWEESLRQPALCELLPVRDYLDNAIVRTNGSFVAGYETAGLNTFFHSDETRNSTKETLEALVRSLPERSMRMQVRYEVTEGHGNLTERYVKEQAIENPVLQALDRERLRMWNGRQEEGHYLERRLHFYFIWNPDVHHESPEFEWRKTRKKTSKWSLSANKCIERTLREHQDLVSEFESLMAGVQATLEATGMQPRRMTDQELFLEAKRALHPLAGDLRPYKQGIAYESARSQVANVNIEDEQDGYLKVGGLLYSWVSLKEMPDATFPGITRELVGQEFPLVISTEIVIPDQSKIMRSYKRRLLRMQAAQRDIHGGFKINVEAQIAQEQLIQTLQEVVSSSLKVCQLSMIVGLRTSRPLRNSLAREEAERILSDRRQRILHAVTRMNGARGIPETLAQKRIYLGTLPGMAEETKREQECLTLHAADLLPVELPWQGLSRFYQFRIAFDRTQAKGSFKVMQDDVADLVRADIILPESSIKPKFELSLLNECQKLFAGLRSGIKGMRFRSSIALGIRDYSRELQFKSSYTLTEHAPLDSLMTEIIPRALEEVRGVVSSALAGDYQKLLEAIGTSTAQPKVEDSEDDEFTSYEHSIVEAVLKADGSGMLVKHPFVNNKLQRLLAKWAFKISTGGGFRMPAFALADDGYLFVHDGQVLAGSDWIPEEGSISSLSNKCGLIIRYPIRMKEDLLPVHMLSFQETVQILEQVLRGTGCGMDSAQIPDIIDRQLRIPGTFTLHSKTAEHNGGDFDFDLVAVLQDSEFPRFVASRFDMREMYQKKKDKKTKIKSPWWNLAEVAMKARGNQIGRITNLISDCIAAGRSDYAYDLVDQLQNALDSLKHNVQVDHEVIRRIREEVPRAPWLQTKDAKRVSDMPMEIAVAQTDIVGQLYNHVRKEIGILFQDVLPLRDFGGMIRGETFTRDMYGECQRMNKTFGILVSDLRKRTEKCEAAVADAQAKFDKVRDHKNPEVRKKASKLLSRAKSALRDNEEQCREEMKKFQVVLSAWGNGKRENRRGWCQALHSLAVASRNDKSTGAIVFQAFPQEALDKLLEETGGRPVQLHLPEMPDGEIVFDDSGNVYRVERIKLDGGLVQERRIFLFRITEHGNIMVDGVPVDSVQPFAIQEGSGEIRDGMVTFSNLKQRPAVRNGKPPALRTREERREFLAVCEQAYGSSFSVFVDGDPASIRQLDTDDRKQAFLDRAPVRPWEARAFQVTQPQQ